MSNLRRAATMVSRSLMATALLTATWAAVPATASAGQVPESTDPIVLTINDWTGQEINTRIMGHVLQSMGYNVKYVSADYLAQFSGLESGDLTVAMEMWETTGKQALAKALKTGNVVDMGPTGMESREEWWFPDYVKEQCPGLPDWKALNKCHELFATPETSPLGRYLGGPVTWGGHDDARIKALGLKFKDIHAGTDAALHAEVVSMIQRHQPFVAWVYKPDWLHHAYKDQGSYVEFPEYTDDCYDDPSWGVNKTMKYDCGKPHGWIKKVAWIGMKDKWPRAYQAVKAFRISNDDIGEMDYAVAKEGATVKEVVDKWMKNNEDTWKKWTQP